MEPRRTFPVKPIRPDPSTLDPGQIVIDYDAIADTLYIHLFGEGRRAKPIVRDKPTTVKPTSGNSA